ncbi:tRNA-dependent cyclodipeptide synthase [Streptomyces sp. NPDC059255]|uniref:tRNA-dependent cyclodipeptide synthase n=1 Tax=Streptomyces sp. NPDC059255 TaxID=3346793 RepID=UPI0036A88D48
MPTEIYGPSPARTNIAHPASHGAHSSCNLRTQSDRMNIIITLGEKVPCRTAFPTTVQVQAVQDYVDAELPFFVDSPRILGVASSVHCYHSVLSLGRLLFSDRAAGLRPAENQDYAVVACQD